MTICGDSLEILKTMADNSVDSVVTDPPYGLSFMGKKWDYDVPSEEIWQECLRVLKPGGYLLAFAGTRTQHRMAVRIEDAGFEIRDMIAWVYGSGFPKSLNIGKAIDKSDKGQGKKAFVKWMQTTSMKPKEIDERLKAKNLISQTSNFSVHFFNDGQPALPTKEYWEEIQAICDEKGIAPPAEIEEYIDLRVYGSKQFREREVIGKKRVMGKENDIIYGKYKGGEQDITIASTDQAKQWEGWGTALKPALEPITVARKPLSEKTVAENVLKWGTGGINIDGSRIPANWKEERPESWFNSGKSKSGEPTYGGNLKSLTETTVGERLNDSGRWPANLIHDGSEEVLELFPNESSRFFYCPKASKKDRDEGLEGFREKTAGERTNRKEGSAGDARNNHPTVKPTALMQYLVKLVTPPNGTVLDPFMGSGSTGKACKKEGFNFIGIDREEEYVKIAEARINAIRV